LIGKGGYKGTGRGFGLDRASLVDLYKCYFDSHFRNAMVLLAQVVMYRIVSDDTTTSFFLRTASVILVTISWLTAPIIFNPYATSESLHLDLQAMADWTQTDLALSKLSDFQLHVANMEPRDPKRKDELNKWTLQRGSWQAWVLRGLVDEWEEQDRQFQKRERWFSRIINLFKIAVQRVVSESWFYLPWLIVGQYYWRLQGLYYFITFAVCGTFVHAIDTYYTNQHENLSIWKASVLIVVPFMVVYFLYGNVTFGELIVSEIMFLMSCFFVLDIGVGIYNLYCKWSVTRKATARGVPVDNHHGMDPRDLLLARMRMPRLFLAFRRLWPYASLPLLSLSSLITVIFSGGLTTLLFNGRVADMWNRAYLYQKQGS